MSNPFKIGAFSIAVLSGSVCIAAPTIQVGDHMLQAGQAGQVITINVTNGAPVAGVLFNVQISDGGSANMDGTLDTGPFITDVDLLTDTIFETNNDGVSDLGSFPQLAMRSVITSSGTVFASGQLATVTLSTVGVPPGVYDLKLFDTLNSYTTFLNSNGSELSTSIFDGTVTVLPEPTTFGLVGLVAAAGMRRSRRISAN